MDFVRYAQTAETLVNAPLVDQGEILALLPQRPKLAQRIVDDDLDFLHSIRPDLRAVFEEAVEGNEASAVKVLNTLLDRYPLSPSVSGHDSSTWHLHVAEKASTSVAITLLTEALMGMAVVACDLGVTRFGVCQATNCTNVFIDISSNNSRRFCSSRCATRRNVAALRARRRNESPEE